MLRLAPLLCAAALGAQSPLTTTFAHDNFGAVGGAVYFDVTVAPAAGITLTGLDLNLSGTGWVAVWITTGGRAGKQTNQALWTLASTGTVNAAVAGAPSPVAIAPFALPSGTWGVALATIGVSHNYTNGTGSNQNYANNELALAAGEASHVSFAAPLFTPRVVNARLHYVVGAATVASNTVLGVGCVQRFGSVYELFATAPAFDLANGALTFQPAGTGYVLSASGAWRPVGTTATPVALALGDDDEVAVPFTVGSFPGWTGLQVCSNGFVSQAAGNGVGFAPAPLAMLAAPQTAFWSQHDFDPTATGSGQVVVEQSAVLTVVTWDGVYDYGGTTTASASRVQFQFAASGAVTIAWGSVSSLGNGWLVGYSPAGPSTDPGGVDLSALGAGTIVMPVPDVLPLQLAASTRPLLGTSWSLVVGDVPATGVLGIDVLGLTDPGIADLAAIGAPTCGLRASLDVLLTWTVAGATHGFALPVPNNPALLGQHVYTTSAVFQVPPVNAFGAITANGIDGRIGNL